MVKQHRSIIKGEYVITTCPHICKNGAIHSSPRCVRCREDYIKEKKERELAELKEISKSAQFKAKPPPPHIYPGNHQKKRF
nr:hypothetical transcript [Hymenolepis microstoma]